jgi:hypothetical protein
MSESKVLRKMFGQKEDEVNAKFRILKTEGLHDLYKALHIVSTVKC